MSYRHSSACYMLSQDLKDRYRYAHKLLAIPAVYDYTDSHEINESDGFIIM